MSAAHCQLVKQYTCTFTKTINCHLIYSIKGVSAIHCQLVYKKQGTTGVTGFSLIYIVQQYKVVSVSLMQYTVQGLLLVYLPYLIFYI